MNKKNLANAQLLNGISTSDTTITVKQNQGEALPATPFFATLTPLGVLSTIDNSEIVQVTARTGDTLTVTRAQRGTTAKEFQAESILANSVYVEDTIPAGGTNGQVLKRNASGDAIWSTDTNTTYTEITEAEMEAGTATTLRSISGRRVGFLKRLIVGISYPVGSLYFNADDGTNPGTLLGVGTWEPYAQGRVPVGKADTGTFANAGDTMGAEDHTLTVDELAGHSHGNGSLTAAASGNHVHALGGWAHTVGGGFSHTPGNGSHNFANQSNTNTSSAGAHTHNITGNTSSAGGNQPHNNIQPSVVVYIWRRTA